jgi:hypothetical protein
MHIRLEIRNQKKFMVKKNKAHIFVKNIFTTTLLNMNLITFSKLSGNGDRNLRFQMAKEEVVASRLAQLFKVKIILVFKLKKYFKNVL